MSTPDLSVRFRDPLDVGLTELLDPLWSAPFAAGALDAWHKGFGPLPLPRGKKYPPPPGLTGDAGRDLSREEIEALAASEPEANLGLRLPYELIGLDIDHYRAKRGADTLEALERRLGPLPATYKITSRGPADPSGIRLFRVPEARRWATSAGPDIDVVQRGHRYVIAPGSLHPDGRRYAIYGTDGAEAEALPEPEDLPMLPPAWVEHLAAGATDGAAPAASSQELARFAAEHERRDRPQAAAALVSAFESLKTRKGSRHDALVATVALAASEIAAGLYTVADAHEHLRRAWRDAMADAPRGRDVEAEYDAAWRWAIAQVNPAAVAEVLAREASYASGPVEPFRPNVSPVGGVRAIQLPDEFWEAHPVLGHVREAAWSRGRAPSAVLASLLARTCAHVPARLVLPPLVGSLGSLNLVVATVAPTGLGKSSTDHLAAELLEIAGLGDPKDPEPLELALGSGEGVSEAFMGTREPTAEEREADPKAKPVREQVRSRVLFTLDEGRALVETGKRSGTTVLSVLRTMATGGRLGQQNAAQENRRHIPTHGYRAALVMGLQETVAAELLHDTEGTPARIVFFAGADATVPAPRDRPGWPGAIRWAPPSPAAIEQGEEYRPGGLRRWAVTVAPNVAAEIQEADWKRQIGAAEDDHRESHRNLNRLKVAALLALLCHGAPRVDSEQWHLAGLVLDHSRAVVDHVAAVERWTARRAEEAATARAARRAAAVTTASEEAAERRARESAVASAAKVVRRHAESGQHEGRGCSGRCLSRAVKGSTRQAAGWGADELAAELLARELIVEDSAGAYRPGPRSLA